MWLDMAKLNLQGGWRNNDGTTVESVESVEGETGACRRLQASCRPVPARPSQLQAPATGAWPIFPLSLTSIWGRRPLLRPDRRHKPSSSMNLGRRLPLPLLPMSIFNIFFCSYIARLSSALFSRSLASFE